jgi:hypothetical protein
MTGGSPLASASPTSPCADMATDEVECIEEGGTEPTIALLRRLTAALDADVRLTPGSVGLETHAA